MRVPLIKPDLPDISAVQQEFAEILNNGRITNFGRYVAEFEARTGEYLGVPTVTVSSGTMGLLFTLCALGLRPRDKVILPSFTFMATAQAVCFAGGIPVFAEVDEDLNISVSDLAELLARHNDIAAVMPVHMYGLPARTRALEEVVAAAAKRRGREIPVLYDAAHAFGAADGAMRVGGFGDAEVFSLSVTKVLVTVEGGLVASRRTDIIERIRSMRNYGICGSYNAQMPGMNGKMSEFHAIVGLRNLVGFEDRMALRQERASEYRTLIESETAFRLVAWPADVRPTFKDFTVRVPHGWNEEHRAVAMARLAEAGVETRAYFFPPVHEQGRFRAFSDRPLPRTEALSRQVITLPFYTTINHAEMEHVVDALRRIEREIA